MEILIPLFIIIIVNIFNKLLETSNKEQEKQQQGRRGPVVIDEYEKMKDDVSSNSSRYEKTSTNNSKSYDTSQEDYEPVSFEETKNLQLEKLAAQMNIDVKEEPVDTLGKTSQSSSLSTNKRVSTKTNDSKQLKDRISRNLNREGLIDSVIMAEVLGRPRAQNPYRNILMKK